MKIKKHYFIVLQAAFLFFLSNVSGQIKDVYTVPNNMYDKCTKYYYHWYYDDILDSLPHILNKGYDSLSHDTLSYDESIIVWCDYTDKFTKIEIGGAWAELVEFADTIMYFPKEHIIKTKDVYQNDVVLVDFNKPFVSQLTKTFKKYIWSKDDDPREDNVRYTITISSDTVFKKQFLGKYDVYRTKLSYHYANDIKWDYYSKYDSLEKVYGEVDPKKFKQVVDWVEGIGISRIIFQYDDKTYWDYRLNEFSKNFRYSSNPIKVNSLSVDSLNIYSKLDSLKTQKGKNYSVKQNFHIHRAQHYVNHKTGYSLSVVNYFSFLMENTKDIISITLPVELSKSNKIIGGSYPDSYLPHLGYCAILYKDLNWFFSFNITKKITDHYGIWVLDTVLLEKEKVYKTKDIRSGWSNYWDTPYMHFSEHLHDFWYTFVGIEEKAFFKKYDIMKIRVAGDYWFKKKALVEFDSLTTEFKPLFSDSGKSYYFILKWTTELGLVGIEEYYDGKNIRNFNLEYITYPILRMPKTPIDQVPEEQLFILWHPPKE